MKHYIKVNDRYYPDDGDRYFYCGQCHQFKHILDMSKGLYECKECARGRAKKYYYEKKAR